IMAICGREVVNCRYNSFASALRRSRFGSPERPSHQFPDVGVLARHVGLAVLRVQPRRLTLYRLIAGRLPRVGAQEIADREVGELLLAARPADVEVVGP